MSKKYCPGTQQITEIRHIRDSIIRQQAPRTNRSFLKMTQKFHNLCRVNSNFLQQQVPNSPHSARHSCLCQCYPLPRIPFSDQPSKSRLFLYIPKHCVWCILLLSHIYFFITECLLDNLIESLLFSLLIDYEQPYKPSIYTLYTQSLEITTHT